MSDSVHVGVEVFVGVDIAKPESTDWPLVSAGFAGWWRVGVGRGVSRRVWCVGACRVGVGGWVGLVALGCVWGVPAPGGWVFR